MAEAVLSLAQNGAARAALGQAARRHALAHLHVDAVLGAAERELAALAVPGRTQACAPATPDGVRPITPKVRAASAAGPRR